MHIFSTYLPFQNTSIMKEGKCFQTKQMDADLFSKQTKMKLLTFNTGMQTLWCRWINSSCINKKWVQSNETLTSQIIIAKRVEMKLIIVKCWIPYWNIVTDCVILALLIMQIYWPLNSNFSLLMNSVFCYYLCPWPILKIWHRLNALKFVELDQVQVQLEWYYLRIWPLVSVCIKA